MTDQNSPARAYSSDVADDDPLAELARIVAGEAPPPPPQRRSVVTPTLPKQPPVQASKPVAAPIEARVTVPAPMPAPTAAIVRRPVVTPSLDLEDALLAELGIAGDKPGRAGARPAAAPIAPSAPGKSTARAAAPNAPSAPAAPATRVSLEDELMAELGFGEPLEAPALDDVPVPNLPIRGGQPVQMPSAKMPSAKALPAQMQPAQIQPVQTPAAARMQSAMPPQMRTEAAPPAPQVQAIDEFEAILNPEPDEEPLEAVDAARIPQQTARADRFRLPPQPEPLDAEAFEAEVFEAEVFNPEGFDAEGFDDGLDAAIQAVNPGMRPAADPLKSFDFVSAFEAEVKQLQVASPPPPPLPPVEALPRAKQVQARQPVAAQPVAAPPVAAPIVAAPPAAEPQPVAPQDFELPEFDEPAIRKPERFELPAFAEPAFAEPVFEEPAPAPQPRILTERELDDHFASAFAEELEMGMQRRETAAEQAADAAAPETRAMIVDERAFEAALDLESVLAKEPADTQTVQQAYRARAERIPDDGFEGMLGQAGLDPAQDWSSDPAALADTEQPQAAAGNAAGQEMRTGSRPGSFRLAAIALAGALVLGLAAVAYGVFAGGVQNNGAPIVVHADNAPVKVKPENPGGTEIANQDQAAYDKVAGAQAGGTQQEQLVTASEKPVEIAPAETAPAGAATAETAPADTAPTETAKLAEEAVAAAPAGAGAAVAPAAAATAADGKAEQRLAPGTVETTAAIPTLAPRRVKTLTIKPDGTVVQPAETAAAPATQEAAFAASGENATLPGVEIGTPLAKEGTASAGAGANQAVSPIETASVTQDAPVGNGEWAVQLASQRSAEDAQATFQNLKQKFPSVLDGKPMSVQRAEVSGKGIFYRVRVPTQTKDEAVALCDELKAAGGSCFITR